MGQTMSWEQFIASGEKLREAWRYAEAEASFRNALQWAESAGKTSQVAQSSNYLALILQLEGRFREAEDLFVRGVAISEGLPDKLNLAITLNNLGDLYNDEAQFDKAEATCNRALDIQSRGFGVDDPRIAPSLDTLGAIEMGRGSFTKAERTFRRAISIGERTLGTEHPETAHMLESTGGAVQH